MQTWKEVEAYVLFLLLYASIMYKLCCFQRFISEKREGLLSACKAFGCRRRSENDSRERLRGRQS